jgi:UDP-N-acetylglucosamine 1-carboxyvinyltransferase
MDALLIHGGNPLAGEVRISGAKNAALPILTASLLSAEPLKLANVPHLKDISTMLALLGHMGVRVTLDDQNHVTLCGESIPHKEAPYEMVKTMRAAILVLGPTLARFGDARCPCPAAAPSVRARSTSISRACRRWVPRSASSMAISMPAASACRARAS